MEFNIDAQIKNLKDYLWLLYPIGVVLFIWISYFQFFTGSGKLLDKITLNEQKISDLTKQKAIRETKLNYLKTQKLDTLQAQLSTLLIQMPYDHMPWDLLTKFKSVGDLSVFKMAENKTIQVEFKIDNSDNLPDFFTKLEGFDPLLSITAVNYNPPLLKLELTSAFDPYQKYNQDFGKPLPNLSK